MQLPHPNAYWLDPGRILAGEYPGSRRPEVSRDKVRRHLEAGVRTFVDLTEPGELTPYAALARDEAARLGVEVEHLRFPIRDLDLPASPGYMSTLLDAIEDAANRQPAVYVHCWGGIGRTGTVIGCLLRRRGWEPGDALAEVARLFGTVEKAPRRQRSPETDAQCDYVLHWPDVPDGPEPARGGRA